MNVTCKSTTSDDSISLYSRLNKLWINLQTHTINCEFFHQHINFQLAIFVFQFQNEFDYQLYKLQIAKLPIVNYQVEILWLYELHGYNQIEILIWIF